LVRKLEKEKLRENIDSKKKKVNMMKNIMERVIKVQNIMLNLLVKNFHHSVKILLHIGNLK